MMRFRLIFGSLAFALIFAFSAFAQAPPPAKIALVNTDAFYADTGGITKIINAYKSLDTEFKTTTTELQNGVKRFQALQTEIQALQSRANDPNNKVPIDQNAARAKVDEAEKLQRDLKFKEEELKAQYSKREQAVLSPITQDIANALGAFAKQKGYTMIMDSGKLVQAQVLLYLQEGTDITKEFITFYNARPAGSATTKP